jgi:integrase
VQTLVAQPQTQRTYDRACRRFVAWLGPLAGPEDLTSTSAEQYDRLLRAARAAIVDEPLAGARDLAILLVLSDAGLRCEELAGLERRDLQPARAGGSFAR